MRLHPSREGLIFFDGCSLPLPPKERAALHLLLHAYPEPVGKDRFAGQIWRGAEMSDESLARCISQLRRLIPLDAGVAIRSIYGFGYQLIAPPADTTEQMSGRHGRVADIANGAPTWVESLLQARALTELPNDYSMERATWILVALTMRAPRYLPARLLLAENLASRARANHDPGGDLLLEAEFQLSVVERLAPHMAGLNALMGQVLDLHWRFEEASRRHARAIREHADDPLSHYVYGYHLNQVGRPADAMAAFRTAADLSPHSLGISMMLCRQEYIAGACEAALRTAAELRSPGEREPVVPSFYHAYRTYLVGDAGCAAEAAHEAACSHWLYARPALSYLFARRGEREKSLRVLQHQPAGDAGRAVTFLPALLELDLADEAMARAEAAAAQRICFLPDFLRKPANANLIRHPRFTQLREAIGLSSFHQDRLRSFE